MPLSRLHLDEEDLRRATSAAVDHFIAKGWSQAKIGREIGYGDGQMISKFQQWDRTPRPEHAVKNLGLIPTANLSRLADDDGCDALAALFIGPSKISIPALGGIGSSDWAPDRDLSQESAGLFRTGGVVMQAVLNGDLAKAWKWWGKMASYVMRWRRELEAIEKRGLPGRFGFHPPAASSGDGLRQEPAAP